MSSKEQAESGDMVEASSSEDNKASKRGSNGHSKISGKSKGSGKLTSNGVCKFTDFPNSSAAQLLKTIVIASQAANQQSAAKSILKFEENPLPRDLQGFQGEPFAMNMNQNSVNRQNSMDDYIVAGIQEIDCEKKAINEVLQVNTDFGSMAQPGKQNGQVPALDGLKVHGLQSPDYSTNKNGVLQRLLSGDSPVTGHPGSLGMSSPNLSPHNSAADSPYGNDSNFSPFTETSQSSVFMDMEPQNTALKDLSVTLSDTTTQSSLITNTGNLRLDSMAVENNMDSDVKYDLMCEWNVTKLEDNLDRAKNGKVPRLQQDSDASSALSPNVDTVFRAESAQQEVPSDFTFQLFGQGEGEQVFPIVSENDPLPGLGSPVLPALVEQPFKIPHNVVKQQRERLRRSKEPILSQPFPAKLHGYEVRILQQPEEQHRARYLTEGSRGAVKNRNGSGFPQVKLLGYTGEATLQVFIGNDSGRVRPHGFYQACKVCGKNSTMCNEKEIDGTTVIEIELQAANDMTASIDCVGILKLRNADVEQRIGIAKAKKKSTKARMIFRVTFQKPCGSPQVLQVASSTILCTQPIGQPEICKMSLKEVPSTGGDELFIIGKNFLRGTRVFFQCVNEDNSDEIMWEKEGEIDKDFFQTTHMIVTVPEYTGGPFVGSKITCRVVVNSGGKVSDPQPIVYTSADPSRVIIKSDTTEAVEESRKRNYPFVAPEALELNQQIQQSQQVSNSSDMFQLPPGMLSGMPENERYTPMEQDSGDGNQVRESLHPENNSETLNKRTSLKHSSALKQTSFGTENLDLSPTPTWDTKDTSEIFNAFDKNDSNMELNSLNFASMNAEDYHEDHPLDPAYMRIKSPRLSNETFQGDSEHAGMGNTTNIRSEDHSIVSQFLQNISMALKHSDPMFSGAETISKSLSSNSTTVLTTVNSHVLMSSAMDGTHNISNGIDKTAHMEHSFLKEALTCPQESLAHQAFSKLQGYTDQNRSSAESGIVEMQTNDDQHVRLNSDKVVSNSESMELSPENSDSLCNRGSAFGNPGTPFTGSVAPNSETSYSTDVTSEVHSPATPYSFNQGQSPAIPFSGASGSQVLSPAAPFAFDHGSLAASPATPYSSASVGQSPVTAITGDGDLKLSSIASPYSLGLTGSGDQNLGMAPSYSQTAQSTSIPFSNLPTVENSTGASAYKYGEPIQQDASSALPPYSLAVSSQMEGSQAPYSTLHQTFSSQPSLDLQFSVADQVLTSLHISESLGSDMKSIASLLGHHNIAQQTSRYHPTHTQTRESASHLKTIMSTVVQENTHPPAMVQSMSGQPDRHFEHGTTHPGNGDKSQTTVRSTDNSNINAVLKQMLSGLPSHQQSVSTQQQFQQQQQVSTQQMFHEQQQQQQSFSQTSHTADQQGMPHVTYSVPGNHGSSVSVTQANVGQVPGPVSVPSQNPAAPQIIICNNPSSPGQLTAGQFGAPSIVIVPGQNSQGNQVENLLRSILGSMMQMTQEQPQQQPPQ